MDAAAIHKLRSDLGLSQVQFGQLVNAHFMTVSRWERGVGEPNAYQVAMMEGFQAGVAQRKAQAQEQVGKLLMGAGVVAAIAFLLSRK